MSERCVRCGYEGRLYAHGKRKDAVCSACWNVLETAAAIRRGESKIDLSKKLPLSGS